MIQVNNLTKRYGKKTAIDDVTFEVKKGEILGFLGPNAAGKTTTMRILTCFFPPTSGSATVAGFDVFESSKDVRQRIGYLPENPPLYPEMTVVEYLKFVSRIKGMPGRIISSRIDEITERVHLEPMRKLQIAKLSKGFKQRVGLAQALIHNPDVLILDEPTVGLDPKQIIEVRQLIKSLAGEHTIILSTHILPEVSMTCDRVVIINDGKVVAQDSTENLTASLQGTERFTIHTNAPADEFQQTVTAIDGITNVQPADERQRFVIEAEEKQEIRHRVARAVLDKGWKLYEIRLETMSLEDIFLQLTTEEPTEDNDE